MKRSSSGVVILAMSALVLALSACQKPEGPAEHAGKELDKAMQNAGKQIEKVGSDIQDAAKDNRK